VAARAAERGASVVGVDVAEAMLALARSRSPGIEFRRGDAESLPFEDASFDAVVANFLLLHLGRPEQAVSEFARVLAPDGRLALTVWDRPEQARFLGVFLDAVAEAGATPPEDIPTGPDFFRFSEDGEFDSLLREQGLEDREVRAVAFTCRVGNLDELWNGLLGGTVRTSALIERQPEEKRGRIREAFDRIAGEYRSGEGFEFPVSVKLGSGRKPDAT
jgi:SAM-dependent methyltransferase